MTAAKGIEGFATPEGTARYKNRFRGLLHETHFRRQLDLWFSSIGMGSYLGDSTEAVDRAYEEALRESLLTGINVIDSAINYRCQRSERSFGRVLGDLIREGVLQRDEIIIGTKGGFLPYDGEYPPDPAGYFREHYIDTGVLSISDIVQGCHAMTPAYLEDQLGRSLENLGLRTIDIYYLHNPETQLAEISRKDFNDRIRRVFEWLEGKVREGKIRWYGTATWGGCRVSPDKQEYLPLDELSLMAREVAGAGHHFRVVQAPVNIAMPEAWVLANQRHGANWRPLLEMAHKLGMAVIGSASLLQARLAEPLPESFIKCFPQLRTSAQCSLQFARSFTGITTSLVGMKSKFHVHENLEVAKHAPLTEEELRSIAGNL